MMKDWLVIDLEGGKAWIENEDGWKTELSDEGFRKIFDCLKDLVMEETKRFRDEI